MYYELALEGRQVTFATFCPLKDSQRPSPAQGEGGEGIVNCLLTVERQGSRRLCCCGHTGTLPYLGRAWKIQGGSDLSLKFKVNMQDLCNCAQLAAMALVPLWPLRMTGTPLDRVEFFASSVEICKSAPHICRYVTARVGS